MNMFFRLSFICLLMWGCQSHGEESFSMYAFDPLTKLIDNEGQLIALSSSGCIFNSNDGIDWSKPEFDNVQQKQISAIVVDDDQAIAVGIGGYLARFTKTKQWVSLNCQLNNCVNHKVIDFIKFRNLFISVNYTGIAYTSNLKDWIYVIGGANSDKGYFFQKLVIADKVLYAFGSSIHYTHDGTTWKKLESSLLPEDIIWDGQQFIAVKRDSVFKSKTLASWDTIYKDESNRQLRTIGFFNGKYYIAGEQGLVASSADLKYWHIEHTGSTATFTDLVIQSKRIILTADYIESETTNNSIKDKSEKLVFNAPKNIRGAIYILNDNHRLEKISMFKGKSHCDLRKENDVF